MGCSSCLCLLSWAEPLAVPQPITHPKAKDKNSPSIWEWSELIELEWIVFVELMNLWINETKQWMNSINERNAAPSSNSCAASPSTFSLFCRPAIAPSKIKIKVEWWAALLLQQINETFSFDLVDSARERKTNKSKSTFFIHLWEWRLIGLVFLSLINSFPPEEEE